MALDLRQYAGSVAQNSITFSSVALAGGPYRRDQKWADPVLDAAARYVASTTSRQMIRGQELAGALQSASKELLAKPGTRRGDVGSTFPENAERQALLDTLIARARCVFRTGANNTHIRIVGF